VAVVTEIGVTAVLLIPPVPRPGAVMVALSPTAGTEPTLAVSSLAGACGGPACKNISDVEQKLVAHKVQTLTTLRWGVRDTFEIELFALAGWASSRPVTVRNLHCSIGFSSTTPVSRHCEKRER